MAPRNCQPIDEIFASYLTTMLNLAIAQHGQEVERLVPASLIKLATRAKTKELIMTGPFQGGATFAPDFNNLGVDEVRAQLEAGTWPASVRSLAAAWLQVQERQARAEGAARNAAVADAQIRAANAAESQAVSAKRALFVAIGAAALALVSIAMSYAALVARH